MDDPPGGVLNRTATSNRAALDGVISPCYSSSIVALKQEGTKQPLFLIHGVDGSIDRFHLFARHLAPDQPAYAIQSQALVEDQVALTRVEDLARYYLTEVRTVQPHGFYHLLGYSFGGLLAFEMARQLRSSGDGVGLLAIIDPRRMAPLRILGGSNPAGSRLERGWSYIRSHIKQVLSAEGLKYATEKVRARSLRIAYTLLDFIDRPIPRFLRSPYDINWFAAVHYTPQTFPVRITVFQAKESPDIASHSDDRWSRLAGDGAEIHEISGGHEDVLDEPYVRLLAREVTACLAKIHEP